MVDRGGLLKEGRGEGAMNQLTISAANAAARRISWSWCGFQFGCSWVLLSPLFSLLRHLHLHSSVHQRFLSHSLTHSSSLSLSPSLSLCGEWRGTESCRKHYVKWLPWLKIHPLHRATLATAAGNSSSRRQLQPNCVACHKAHPARPHPPQHLPNATENSCFLYKYTHIHIDTLIADRYICIYREQVMCSPVKIYKSVAHYLYSVATTRWAHQWHQ